MREMRRPERDDVVRWVERIVTYSLRFWLLFAGAVCAATFAYLFVHNTIVPGVSCRLPVYFDFDDKAPTAGVTLAEPIMVPGHTYALTLLLRMPESRPNVNAGNFMVGLTLLNRAYETRVAVKRPAILRYSSDLLRGLGTMTLLPLMMLGRKDESQLVDVPLVESFYNDPQNPAETATLFLSRPGLQVYDATLAVTANLHGVSFYMHTYRIPSFLIGVSTLVFIQFALLAMLQFRSRRVHLPRQHTPPGGIRPHFGDEEERARPSASISVPAGTEMPHSESRTRRAGLTRRMRTAERPAPES